MIRNLSQIALVGGVLWPATGWAQAGEPVTSVALPATATQAADVEQIVVTGSRTEKAVDDSPVPVDVVARTEIVMSGAETLGELLETQPGIQLQRAVNGTGVSLQGLNPEQVLILVDGERTAGRVRNQFDIERFNLANVEQVEIVRGAASALYGADAMGGVINIITRRATSPVSADARVTYGSYDALDGVGSLGARLGDLSVRASGGYHHFAGFDLDTDTTNTTGPAFDNADVTVNTTYDADASTQARLRVDYRRSDIDATDLIRPRAIIDRQERIETMSISAGPTVDLNDSGRLLVTISHSRYRQQIVQDQRGGTDFDSSQDNRQTASQATVQYDRLVGGAHYLSLGLEGFSESQDVEFLSERNRTRRRGAVFVQDDWSAIDEYDLKLYIVPSIRVDSDSQFGSRASPRLAVRLDPTESIALRASYGWGFRAPTFENLYLEFTNTGSGYRIDGNESLSPERSQNVNADVAFTLHEGLTLSIAGYYNDVENLIATIRYPNPDDAPCGPPSLPTGVAQWCLTNVAESQTYGGSASIAYRLGPYGSVRTSVELLRTNGTFPRTDGGSDEHELPNRANVRATAQLLGIWPNVGTRLSIRAAVTGPAELFADFDSDGSPDVIGTYALLDVRISQRLFGVVELFIGAENLLDAGDPINLPLIPRTFFAGIGGHYDVSSRTGASRG